MMTKIMMKLYEIREYDRKLNCVYCQLYSRCHGDIKIIESRNDHFGHYRCRYFRDIIT